MVTISDKKDDLDMDTVLKLLKQTYWAKERSEDTIRKAINNSLCFGAYLAGSKQQVAFARVVTDYATTFYLCDVIVDEAFRGKGIGKKLIQTIVSDEKLKSLRGLLLTRDAHGLYGQFGFEKEKEKGMTKNPD